MTNEAEHRLEVVSRFWVIPDNYTCECSCGWRGRKVETSDAALEEGRKHLAEATAE